MELSGNLQAGAGPRREPLNILLLGKAGSGKSGLKNRIIHNQLLPEESFWDPTFDELSQKLVTVNSKEYFMDIAELDSEDYISRVTHEACVLFSDGIILMYSICSPESFSALESIWTSVELLKVREKKVLYVDIVGTMSDLGEKRSVKTEDGKALAQRLNCGFSECSAKEGENCEALIEDLIRKIVTGREQEQEKILTDARRRKEDEARDERGRGKNGVVKRVLRRFLAWFSRRA